jgi:membrane fusion protein, peptide pheromone/bacteriocin exporter
MEIILPDLQLRKISRRSRIIYTTLLIAISCSIVALPFVFITISIRSIGLLRSNSENKTVKTISPGLITQIVTANNSKVSKDQILVKVSSPILEEKIHFIKSRYAIINSFIHDIQYLIKIGSLIDVDFYKLNTSLYRQSLSKYQRQWLEFRRKFTKIETDYLRNQKLFNSQTISASDYENISFEYTKAMGDLNILEQSQLSSWALELKDYEKELAELTNQWILLNHEKNSLDVKSPINGTIQNLISSYVGSPLQLNQDICEIVPDTSLMAEINVLPSDIGLLHEGMDVRIKVSAFNYSQWGIIHGKIRQISNNAIAKDNQTSFLVTCNLDQQYLTLKSGQIGYLKSGMIVQAICAVTQRSLWQLLFDRIDDWLNPNSNKILNSEF